MVARGGVPRVPSGGVAIKHTGKVEMGRTDLNGEIVLDAGRPSHGTVYCVSLTPMLDPDVEMGRTDLNGEIVLDAGRPSHGTVYCVSLTPMLPMFDDATANTIARLTPGPHTN